MFCPECGVEYRPGFTHSTDCDVDLVQDLPETPRVLNWLDSRRISRLMDWGEVAAHGATAVWASKRLVIAEIDRFLK